jgi:hypothetical protein
LATNWPAQDDYDGEFGEMIIGRGNWSTWRKPAPMPLCPPKSHITWLGMNPGCRGGKPATNRLSYGTADMKIKAFTSSKSKLLHCTQKNSSQVIYSIKYSEEVPFKTCIFKYVLQCISSQFI